MIWYNIYSYLRICYDLDSRSNVHSQGHRGYIMKYLFQASASCINTNRTTSRNKQQNKDTTKTLSTEWLWSVRFITVTHLVLLTDLRAKVHPRNNCAIVSLSRMLNDILILDQQWLPNQSDIPPISWPLYRAWPSPIMSGFHGAFATGVASQQGTLTLPDTWFRPPFWDLLMLHLLRPNSSNLPCLYSTFHLEYPLVLSRFCLKG